MYMLETLHPLWWSWKVFSVLSAMWTQTTEVRSLHSFLFFPLTRLFSRWVFFFYHYGAPACMNVRLNPLKSTMIIMCVIENIIFKKKKDHCERLLKVLRLQYEVIVVICVIFAFCRREKPKIKGAGRLIITSVIAERSLLSILSIIYSICHSS